MNIKTGLSEDEVKKYRSLYGKNLLTKKKQNTFFSLLIESLNDPIIKILLIALAIKIVFLFRESNIYETIGIVIAIFLASFISTISEYGSEKAFERLVSESSKMKSKVIRNSKKIEINNEEIVVNDIVCLSSGDKVSADGIVVSGSVSVDESSLTGEAKEKHKKIGEPLFMGSIISDEFAVMKVTNVGDKTYYGDLASSIQDYAPQSPLKMRLRGLAKIISRIGYIGAILVFLSYLVNVIIIKNGFDTTKIVNMISNSNTIIPHIFYALTLSVTIIVVAVPEGLPMMITLVLSSNMKRMLKNNVLVRKLVGIETAGSLNILFTDKTGTLTEGKLKVISININNMNYRSVDEIRNEKLKEIISNSLLYNNESEYDNGTIIGGNTTDKAILSFLNDKEKKYIVQSKKSFNSERKYSSVTINYDNKTTFFKGAYEVLIDKCKFYYDELGNKKVINNIEQIKKNVEKYTKEGIRILVMCSSSFEGLRSLTLIGFIFLKDNVRETAKKGLDLVNKAGISTIMITGDAKDTAVSIANNLGMINKESIILTSEELSKMTDDEVKKAIPYLKVLARSMPQDKLRLVKLSQELGLVVGMTGDGINDAPALKKADVGFGMGSGTEVAKEVSDIIILDDNILSIASSILFGRTIFKSIRKFIIFQLTINFCAVFLSIIGPYFGILSPITVIQMLWINMVMDTLAGLAFAFEPPLLEYMEEMPKLKNEPIMNKYMINQILFDGLYCSILCLLFLKLPFLNNLFRIGNKDEYLMTAFFGLFIFLAIFNLFNARSHRINILANILKNKVFILVILFIAIVQVILIYFGGEIFRTTGLTFAEFQIMILLSFSVIPIDIIRKMLLRTKKYKGGV